jgi:drug/metabolite transporter (DMT)-like permease
MIGAGPYRVQPLAQRQTLKISRRSISVVQAIAQPPVRQGNSPKTTLNIKNLLQKSPQEHLQVLTARFTTDEPKQFTTTVLKQQQRLVEKPEVFSEQQPSSSGRRDPDNNNEDDEENDNLSKLSSNSIQLPPYFQKIVDRIPPRVRGLLMLNLLVVMVATNWVVLKEAGTHFNPFNFASLRFGIAALALSPFFLKAKPQTYLAGLELGMYTAVGYLAQSEGLMTTDASRASFLSTFTVLVVPFLAGLSGKGVRPITWAAAVAALVGVSLLEKSGAEPCLGDLWSVISAIAFGVQIFRTEHYSRILGQQQTIPLTSVVLTTTAAMAIAAAGFAQPEAVHALFTHPETVLASIEATTIPWGEILYTSLLTTDVVLLMEFVALRDVNSTEAALTYMLEPLGGAMLACIFLGEKFETTGWIGGGLILVSCLGMQLLGEEKEAEVAEGKKLIDGNAATVTVDIDAE